MSKIKLVDSSIKVHFFGRKIHTFRHFVDRVQGILNIIVLSSVTLLTEVQIMDTNNGLH